MQCTLLVITKRPLAALTTVFGTGSTPAWTAGRKQSISRPEERRSVCGAVQAWDNSAAAHQLTFVNHPGSVSHEYCQVIPIVPVIAIISPSTKPQTSNDRPVSGYLSEIVGGRLGWRQEMRGGAKRDLGDEVGDVVLDQDHECVQMGEVPLNRDRRQLCVQAPRAAGSS